MMATDLDRFSISHLRLLDTRRGPRTRFRPSHCIAQHASRHRIRLSRIIIIPQRTHIPRRNDFLFLSFGKRQLGGRLLFNALFSHRDCAITPSHTEPRYLPTHSPVKHRNSRYTIITPTPQTSTVETYSLVFLTLQCLLFYTRALAPAEPFLSLRCSLLARSRHDRAFLYFRHGKRG